MEGTAEEIMIHAKEFRNIKSRLNEILIKHTATRWKRWNKIPTAIAL